MPKPKERITLVSLLKIVMRANHSVTLYKKSHESDLHFEKSESHFRSQKTLDSYEKPKSDFPTLLQDDKLHCVACQC